MRLPLLSVLLLSLFAGCSGATNPDCLPPPLSSTSETSAILDSFCSEDAARWKLTEHTPLFPYSGVWCLEQTYIVNDTIIKEEILLGTKIIDASFFGSTTYSVTELKGPYASCEGRL